MVFTIEKTLRPDLTIKAQLMLCNSMECIMTVVLRALHATGHEPIWNAQIQGDLYSRGRGQRKY